MQTKKEKISINYTRFKITPRAADLVDYDYENSGLRKYIATILDDTSRIEVTDNSFVSVIVIDGQGELSNDECVTKFIKGDSIFIPAQSNLFKIQGHCKLIITYL